MLASVMAAAAVAVVLPLALVHVANRTEEEMGDSGGGWEASWRPQRSKGYVGRHRAVRTPFWGVRAA